MAGPYLEIEDLRHTYGPHVVVDVDKLVVERGEVLAIIGANGAGKSTLLKLMALLEKPASGTISFSSGSSSSRSFSSGVEDELAARRRLAMVFQEPLLFSATVFDNIAYGLKVRKVSRREIDGRVREVAGMLGVSHLLGRSSNNLSGGEAQRVSLARALVLNPELLLLDEPMASLDPPTKESLIVDLQDILVKLDLTVVYVTHQRSEAVLMADRIAVMDGGRIVQVGTSREILNRPVDETVARLVGVENILKGSLVGTDNGLAVVKIEGTGVDVEVEAVESKSEHLAGKVWVFLRPENVSITLDRTNDRTNDMGEPEASAGNGFSGEIVKLYDTGSFYRVVVDCGFELAALVTKRSADEMGLQPGLHVRASFNAAGAHVAARVKTTCI